MANEKVKKSYASLTMTGIDDSVVDVVKNPWTLILIVQFVSIQFQSPRKHLLIVVLRVEPTFMLTASIAGCKVIFKRRQLVRIVDNLGTLVPTKPELVLKDMPIWEHCRDNHRCGIRAHTLAPSTNRPRGVDDVVCKL